MRRQAGERSDEALTVGLAGGFKTEHRWNYYRIEAAARAASRARNCRLVVEEGHRFDTGNVETFPAAHVLARGLIVDQHHVALGFGELSAVAFVASAGHTVLLLTDDPFQFVGIGGAAIGAVQLRRLARAGFGIESSLVHLLTDDCLETSVQAQEELIDIGFADVHGWGKADTVAVQSALAEQQAVFAGGLEKGRGLGGGRRAGSAVCDEFDGLQKAFTANVANERVLLLQGEETLAQVGAVFRGAGAEAVGVDEIEDGASGFGGDGVAAKCGDGG